MTLLSGMLGIRSRYGKLPVAKSEQLIWNDFKVNLVPLVHVSEIKPFKDVRC